MPKIANPRVIAKEVMVRLTAREAYLLEQVSEHLELSPPSAIRWLLEHYGNNQLPDWSKLDHANTQAKLIELQRQVDHCRHLATQLLEETGQTELLP